MNAQDKECYQMIVGDWKVYQIEPALGIPPKASDYGIWHFKKDSVQIKNKLMSYLINDDCSKLVLKINQEKEFKFLINRFSKGTLFLKNRILPHETYYIKFLKID